MLAAMSWASWPEGLPPASTPRRWPGLERRGLDSTLWAESVCASPAATPRRPGTGLRPSTGPPPSAADAARPRTAASARGLALSARASLDAACAAAAAATEAADVLLRGPVPQAAGSRPSTAAAAPPVPPSPTAQAWSSSAVDDFLQSLRAVECLPVAAESAAPQRAEEAILVSEGFPVELRPSSVAAFLDGLLGAAGAEAEGAGPSAADEELDRRLAWAPRPIQPAWADEPSAAPAAAGHLARVLVRDAAPALEASEEVLPFFTRRKPLQRPNINFHSLCTGDHGADEGCGGGVVREGPVLPRRQPLRRIDASGGSGLEAGLVATRGDRALATDRPSLTSRTPLLRVAAPAPGPQAFAGLPARGEAPAREQPASATGAEVPSLALGDVAPAAAGDEPPPPPPPPPRGAGASLAASRPATPSELLEDQAEASPRSWTCERFADPSLPAGLLARLALGGARGSSAAAASVPPRPESRERLDSRSSATAFALDVGTSRSAPSRGGDAGSRRANLRASSSGLRLPRLEEVAVPLPPEEKLALARGAYRSSSQRQLVARRAPPQTVTVLAEVPAEGLPLASSAERAPSWLPPIPQPAQPLEKIPWSSVAAASGGKALLRRQASERPRLSGGGSPPDVFWAEVAGLGGAGAAAAARLRRGSSISRSAGRFCESAGSLL